MLNTNVCSTIKFGTVGPLVNQYFVATCSAGSQLWHDFDPILVQVNFNIESTLYDSNINVAWQF